MAPNSKSEAAQREEKVLEFWRANKIFEKSLEKTKKGKEFVFYEGPPTANGRPGIHHLEARAFKDAIPRYKTMQGFHVRRKAGWDTHGLPVELQVEKKLGLNSKKAIEEYGIAKFNQECKESVWEYLDIWNHFTERIGFWLDQENPYVTYENKYIESVWNVISEADKQKLLYKDYKVVPWCPRCGTALSSHELAQGYEEVKDLSIYAKFKIKGVENGYFLAWTTTPWTLPGNIALAVGEKINYVEAKVGDEILVLAKDRMSILPEGYEIIATHTGKEMVGMEYEPLYSFIPKDSKNFKVYPADFVNTEDGTGIVHTAVMYGQDDFNLGNKFGLTKMHLVTPEGEFKEGTDWLSGRSVIDENLAVDILKDLQGRGLLFGKEKYSHSYPFCWRCKTRLIYYARDSWYIRMSDPKIKKELIAENKKINWEPAHIKEGRFGEWLRELKDWAISRERFWGTPLPVWIAKDGEKLVVDSLATLKKYSKKSGNKYFIVRHGEAQKNVENISNTNNDNPSPLTEKGKERASKAGKQLKKYKPDVIFASPLLRTQETAKIIAETVGYPAEKIITEDRIREINTGEFNGKPIVDYRSFFSSLADRFSRRPEGGENLMDVKRRVGQFLYETDQKYANKNIVIVSHEDAIWMMESAIKGLDKKESMDMWTSVKNEFIVYAAIHELEHTFLPHNSNFELDLHRPYIDEIVLEKGGKEFHRTKEVMDVWLDSGAMPFAQDHFPFSVKKIKYPADYISEAIDQTRGWFYTLHAVGAIMGKGRAYKNVICLGHLMDAQGKKMSKSLGNIVDPWEALDKYGADTLRLWMYSVNQPGESKNFDEKTVQLLNQQVFGLLYNVLAFYELYPAHEHAHEPSKSKNVLDQWVISKLNELIKLSTDNLDNFKLLEPTRAIRDFVGDLSTWYLRRSRERIKAGDKDAKATLYFVLKTLAQVISPFAPFVAEDIWLRLRNKSDKESVHLTGWPTAGKVDTKVLKEMELVRESASELLKERQKADIPVRQVLSTATGPTMSQNYVEILKEEINVKEYKDTGIVSLDTNITPDLKQEGIYRELLRAVQDMRKKMGLKPSEAIKLTVETGDQGKKLIQKFEADLARTVLAREIKFGANDGDDIKAGELSFKIKIIK